MLTEDIDPIDKVEQENCEILFEIQYKRVTAVQ